MLCWQPTCFSCPPPHLQGRKQGHSRDFPSVVQELASLRVWQEAAARQWLRHLWLRSWRGWLPPPAAFSGGKKDQRAPEQSRTVGHQRAGIFPTGCKEVSLPWGAKCLAVAAAHGCACQPPLQRCRGLPHVRIHAMPHHTQEAQAASLLTLFVGVSSSPDGDGHFPPRAQK